MLLEWMLSLPSTVPYGSCRHTYRYFFFTRDSWKIANIKNVDDYTNMERAQVPVSDVESRNVSSMEPTALRSRHASSDRNDILPFLLLPDITLAIEGKQMSTIP